jgi:hypothetical protein
MTKCEAFLYTGQEDDIPADVSHIKFHPSVIEIQSKTCQQRAALKRVEFPDTSNLQVIGSFAFSRCWSLKKAAIPSTIQVIGENAFASCWELCSLELPEGRPNTRGASTCTLLSNGCRISSCSFPPPLTIQNAAFSLCRSLRNIALPTNHITVGDAAFVGCTDLQKIFPHDLTQALTHRLDDLPIHRLCYYQSYHPTAITIQRLRKAIDCKQDCFGGGGGGCTIMDAIRRILTPKPNLFSASSCTGTSLVDNQRQDCFGMTPLHILACSSKQSIQLYDLLIQEDPLDLITKDKWGDLPIHYAYMTEAPMEIVEFLLNSQQYAFPDHCMEWEIMIEKLCVNHTSLESIEMILTSQKSVFPEQKINVKLLLQNSYKFWKTVPLSIIRLLIQHQESTFPEQRLVWKRLFRRLKRTAHALKDLCVLKIQFLLHKSIGQRMELLGIQEWQKDMEYEIHQLPQQQYNLAEKKKYMDRILSKLAKYEQREIAALLELVLWKMKLQEEEEEELAHSHETKRDLSTKDQRRLCHVNCKANVVISNVLPFFGDGKKKRRRKKRVVDYVMNEV